jgi:pSer/pThr/pTyr-binding forkhead associated (FHA) protein
LVLQFGGRDLTVNSGGGITLVLGRDAACDVVVPDRRASRQHARIEARRDKFALVDQSSNGTYVKGAGVDEIVLRREELILSGTGRIGLGHSPDAPDAVAVEFRCE